MEIRAEIGGSALTLGETAKRLVEQRRAQSVQSQSQKVGIDPKIEETRMTQLKQAFDLIDTDGSGTISLAEITRFLQSTNKDLNPDYIREIHSSLDTNGDGQVSISEFISGYLRQVNQLSEAIADLHHNITLTKEAISAAEGKLSAAQRISQSQNEYGVPSGSRLKVTVREAQSLPRGVFALKSYSELSFEKQIISTNVQEGENPKWEESFEFLAHRPDGKLICKVIRKDAITSDDTVGECEVLVEELRDQKTKDIWKQLLAKGKPVGSAKVFLSLQLIFDEAKRLREEIEQLQQSVSSDEQLLSQLQQELSHLGASPLGMIQSSSLTLRLEQRVLSAVASVPTEPLEVMSLDRGVVACARGDWRYSLHWCYCVLHRRLLGRVLSTPPYAQFAV